MTTVSGQIPFNLEHDTSYAREDFIVAGCNRLAYTLTATGAAWQSHALALIGPKGCGKSHLASCWLEENNAELFTPAKDIASLRHGSALLLEDIDQLLESKRITETDLFHLYNWIKEQHGRLLFTAQCAPSNWPLSLPDMASRAATIEVVEIQKPDDEFLNVILVKLFSDKQLDIKPKVIHYILQRMDRSFEAAQNIVSALDNAALSKKQKITIPLVKSCLEGISA